MTQSRRMNLYLLQFNYKWLVLFVQTAKCNDFATAAPYSFRSEFEMGVPQKLGHDIYNSISRRDQAAVDLYKLCLQIFDSIPYNLFSTQQSSILLDQFPI